MADETIPLFDVVRHLPPDDSGATVQQRLAHMALNDARYRLLRSREQDPRTVDAWIDGQMKAVR